MEKEYKKKYNTPEADIEMFTVKDVVRTSPHGDEDDSDPFGDF